MTMNVAVSKLEFESGTAVPVALPKETVHQEMCGGNCAIIRDNRTQGSLALAHRDLSSMP